MDISIFRCMYFGAASRYACGCGVVASARADAPALGASALGYNRRSERIGVPITRNAGVCAFVPDLLLWLRPVRPAHLPIVARRARPHARAARGRDISSTKVKALPESLGNCTNLASLCVRCCPPPVHVRGGAGAALLRVALPRRVLGPGRAALYAAAALLLVAGRAEPRARMSSARGQPARLEGWAGAARRGHTVARRDASNTELAALPAVVDWPNLREL